MYNFNCIIIIITLLLLCTSSSLPCISTGYVNAATGIDSPSAGDESTPLATIFYALNTRGICSGGLLHVSSGEHLMEPLNMVLIDNVTILGEGASVTVLKPHSSTISLELQDSGVSVWKDFSILGASISNSVVRFDNCKFEDLLEIPINVDTHSNVSIHGCSFRKNKFPTKVFDSRLEIDNCIFENNEELGALVVLNSDFNIKNSIFQNNSFILIDDPNLCLISNLNSDPNSYACGGGAIAAAFSSVVIYNCSFNSHRIFENAPGSANTYTMWGATLLLYGNTITTIDKCVVQNSIVELTTGSLEGTGELFYIMSERDIIVSNSYFSNPSAPHLFTTGNMLFFGNEATTNLVMSNVTAQGFSNTAFTFEDIKTVEVKDSVFFNITVDFTPSAISIGADITNFTISRCSFSKTNLVTIANIVATLVIKDSMFSHNNVLPSVVSSESANTYIFNNKFENNTGSCIYAQKNIRIPDPGYMLIQNTTFTNNSGANCVHSTISLLQLQDSKFLSNSVPYVSVNGGLILINLCELIVDECLFDQNSGPFGGAIYAVSDTEFTDPLKCLITNSNFTDNDVTGVGGAIMLSSPAPTYALSVDGCLFARNEARDGGALYAQNSDIEVKNSVFVDNSGLGSGGAVYYTAGVEGMHVAFYDVKFIQNIATGENSAGGSVAIFLDSGVPVSSVMFQNCEFTDSSASNGGAMMISSNDVSVEVSILPTGYPETKLINCSFSNNTAKSGGAIYSAQFATTHVINSTLSFNSAEIDGGAVQAVNSRILFENVKINNCTSVFNGGALSISVTEPLFPYSEFNGVEFRNNEVSLGNGGAIALAALARVRIRINSALFDNNYALSFGGAIYAGTYSAPEITNSIFSNNDGFEGAGLYAEVVAAPRISDTLFLSNSASSDGGAVGCAGKSAPKIERVQFLNNTAANGGALSSSAQSSVSLINCSFAYNEAVDSGRGGAIYATTTNFGFPSIVLSDFDSNTAAEGGAHYGSASAVISTSTFKNNKASTEGGAVHISLSSNTLISNTSFINNTSPSGGAIFSETFAILQVNYGTFRNNTATEGGAVQATGRSAVHVTSSSFSSNSATSGGSVYVEGNIFSFRDTQFSNNKANGQGGAMYLLSGMSKTNVNTTLSNLRFLSCSATTAGGALFWHSTASNIPSFAPVCDNCVFSGNTASYGSDVATAPTRQFFSMLPTELLVRDGVIGPFSISLVDFYDQVVTSVVFRSAATIKSIGNEVVQPQLSGTTEMIADNGNATYPELAVSGLFDHNYTLHFTISGTVLGTVNELVVNVLFRGCSVGQEQITTSTKFNTCKLCSAGSYNLNGNGSCIPCPAHVKCTEGVQLVANDNYWLYYENGIADVYNCPDGYCEGGECGEHRSGLLCGTCDEGFQSSFGKCIICDSDYEPGSLAGNIILVWIFVILLQYSSKLPSKTSTREDRYVISGLTKIILFFVQTIPLVSSPSDNLRRLFSFLNFQFLFSFATRCTIRLDFFGNFLLSIFMPAILFGLLTLNFILHNILHFIARKSQQELLIEHTSVNKTMYFRTICALVLFSYSQVSTAVLSYLNCREVGPFSVVASSPDVSCDSHKYLGYSAFAYVLCIYIALLPVVLFALMVRYHRKGKLTSAFISEKFGILFQCFKSKHYYWEVVILVRRLLFIMIFVLAYSVPSAQTLALFIFSFLVLVLHLIVNPYYSKIENWIETTLLSLLVLLAGIECAEASAVFESEIDTLSAVIMFLAIIPIAVGLYFLVSDIMKRLGIHPCHKEPKVVLSRTTTVETWKGDDL